MDPSKAFDTISGNLTDGRKQTSTQVFLSELLDF